MSIPQYMASGHPDVLSAVRENARRKAAFFDAIRAWADDLGFDNAHYMTIPGRIYATGLPSKPEGRGDWTEGRGTWRPFKKNTAEMDRLTKVREKFVEVPGLPKEVNSEDDRDGRHYIMWPEPFEREGRVWIGYSHMPARRQFGKDAVEIDPRWVEVLASEYQAARAAHVDGAS